MRKRFNELWVLLSKTKDARRETEKQQVKGKSLHVFREELMRRLID